MSDLFVPGKKRTDNTYVEERNASRLLSVHISEKMHVYSMCLFVSDSFTIFLFSTITTLKTRSGRCFKATHTDAYTHAHRRTETQIYLYLRTLEYLLVVRYISFLSRALLVTTIALRATNRESKRTTLRSEIT